MEIEMFGTVHAVTDSKIDLSLSKSSVFTIPEKFTMKECECFMTEGDFFFTCQTRDTSSRNSALGDATSSVHVTVVVERLWEQSRKVIGASDQFWLECRIYSHDTRHRLGTASLFLGE